MKIKINHWNKLIVLLVNLKNRLVRKIGLLLLAGLINIILIIRLEGTGD